jgi:glycosyltransferase involved in cell wall biosynthesis
LKILLLNDFGTLQGGAEAQLVALRDMLRARGHDVRLFTSRAPCGDLPFQSDYLCAGTTTALRAVTQVLNLSAYWTLRRVLRAFKPDVVHARVILWQLSPIILPLLRNVPSVFNAADYKPACPTAKKILPDGQPCGDLAGLVCLRHGCCRFAPQWAFEMLQRRLWLRYRDCIDCVVAQSEGARLQLEALGIAVSEVVHNGVIECPERPPLEAPPLIAFAGRLSPEKGIRTLVEAFRRVLDRVPDAKLLIAGTGPERGRIEEDARRWGVSQRLELTGHLSKAEMEARLGRAWVQAVPSLWHEPFPNVATEAMMRGTPVVASSMGGLPEIVKDGETGFLVPPRDPASLADALTALVTDRRQAERMGRAARERARSLFSMEKTVSRFERLYEKILK